MNAINQTLANIGCGITDLPKEFQDRINSVNKLESKVEEARKEYESNPTEEEKEKLDEIETFYEDFVLETCDMIETWDDDVKTKASEEAEKKAKNEAAKKAQEEAEAKKKAEEEAANNKPAEKKSGIGLGGFILGAVVLIATAGAVNAFRNK